MEQAPTRFVAECFWPDIRRSDLDALDRRVRDATAELARTSSIRYLGSMLLREDEVVFCQFEGSAAAVRAVAERAGIPFERVIETVFRESVSPAEDPTPERSSDA
ncbi:MAG TPA: nickel-binding protein [Gaiellaceae bacterium]|nr:nickel-binding protein [Gaiellaceae bacterium]